MKVTISYDDETGLIEIHSSSGTLSMTQTETAGLYLVLRDMLGWKGRLSLFFKRRHFRTVN